MSEKMFEQMVKTMRHDWKIAFENNHHYVITNGTYTNRYEYYPKLTEILQEKYPGNECFVSAFSIFENLVNKNIDSLQFQFLFRYGHDKIFRVDYVPDENRLFYRVIRKNEMFRFSVYKEDDEVWKTEIAEKFKKVIDDLPQYRLLRLYE
jgi:hypothetical protein